MDNPVADLEPNQKMESLKNGTPMLHCNFFDTEVVHKIGEILLPGLATACVDNTSGDLFKSPGSVAVDIRKEMVDYLTQRSETFVAESLIEDGSPYVPTSDDPIDIIADFVDDFANSKQNMFSRISGWLLSESREEKIDDFVQEMELRDFWVLERRAAVAQTLLKNIDIKSKYYCNMKFDTEDELIKHANECTFRILDCTNEGCRARVCARHMEEHDSFCPFKILPCEQKCSETLPRREMDRHCITICPMKLVNCPFYHVGCRSSIPHCTTEQHCSEFLQCHLLYILQVLHKEASTEDLKYRVEQLQKSSSLDVERLSEARDVRSLTRVVKELDAKMGPLEPRLPSSENGNHTDSADISIHASDETESRAQSSQEPSVASKTSEEIADVTEGNVQQPQEPSLASKKSEEMANTQQPQEPEPSLASKKSEEMANAQQPQEPEPSLASKKSEEMANAQQPQEPILASKKSEEMANEPESRVQQSQESSMASKKSEEIST